ncbi:M42 family metallopeptidase [Salinisphaera orenii]|uniref:M42 family metallopeptidase n=1 Tax=Salinisphaera orenii TaxID=856731 RepID=UPI0019551013
MTKNAYTIDDHALDFLERYLNNPAPVGYEAGGQRLWMDYLKPYVDQFITDSYGSAVGVINPDADYKVVIEGHADEIGWMVNHITDNGMLYVIRNGGSDHQIATSKRVSIHTDNGVVPGVFGWPAIHIRDSSQEKQPQTDNIFIDVGAHSADEVAALGIHIGCPVTYPDPFETLNDDKFVCRALDNRIGGFIIAEVARRFHELETRPNFGLYIVNSVQEEVGLRGAAMIAETITPDAAIVIDATHDTSTPMVEPTKAGSVKIGDGPVITHAPAVQNRLRDHIVDTAKQNGMTFQRNAKAPGSGTDTDSFAVSGRGVPSALIAPPLRYMHTTVEMVQRSDVEQVIDLLYRSVAAIETGETFSYFE